MTGAKENINTVKEIATNTKEIFRTVSETKQELNNLSTEVEDRIKGSFAALKLEVKASMLPRQLDEFLGEVNPLVEAFTGLSSLIKTGEYDPKSLSQVIDEKFFGKDVQRLLENPASSVVLLNMEQKKPGFLFNMLMETATPLNDVENIPLNTTVQVRYSGWESLMDYLDRSATLPQILPDPTVTGIKVTPRQGGDPVEYTRTLKGTAFEFVSKKDQSILKLADVGSFVVTEKGGDRDRAKLWKQQRTVDISTAISSKLSGDLPDDKYENKEEGQKVRNNYRAMPESEKVSDSGSKAVGCYKTAENLARRNGFNLYTAKAAARFDSSEEQYNMLTAIPDDITRNNRKPGTVYWIKKNPAINDPKSVNPAAGNHFFTYVGTVETAAGKKEPYFVDQFGFGNLARMSFSYPKRFLHQVFTPQDKA